MISARQIKELVIELRSKRFLSRYLERLGPDRAPYRLGPVGAATLALIGEATGLGVGLNQKEIAKKIGSSPASISPVLKKLRKAKFCENIPRSDGRRGQLHGITPSGREALNEWILWWMGEPELPTVPFNADQREVLAADLREQLRHLNVQVAKAIRS